MRRPLLVLGLLLIPAVALALDFTNSSGRYSDAPFSLSEAAGISVLTNLGAVQGNPDGTFAAERTLNRAEFTKIVMLSNPSVSASASDADACFPDVKKSDWFSAYICLSKRRNIVSGYPDGYFRPANAVNYVEAVKILAGLYDYTLPEPPANERWAWYTAYMKAAEEHNVLLPGSVANDALLTRGQMARLAAAFRAESEGQLDQYRLFEKGKTGSSSSSKNSSSSTGTGSSASSVSSVSSSSSRSSSSVSSVLSSKLFPAVSHFLVAGQITPALFDANFTSDTTADLQSVNVELFREIKGVESLALVDGNGKELATLLLKVGNNTNNTKWEGTAGTGALTFPPHSPVRLGIRAHMKAMGNGGSSNELLEYKSLSIWVRDPVTGVSQQVAGTDINFPQHQTAFGRITSLKNNLATTMSVTEGNNRTLGTFTLTAQTASGGSVQLQGLTFVLNAIDVSVTNIHIGGSSATQQTDCGTEKTDSVTSIVCPSIPDAFRTLSTTPMSLSVYGNVSLNPGRTSGSVRLATGETGSIGRLGVVSWNDSSTTFNWVESDIILEDGPTIAVTK